jgi:hypothetical protein
LASEPILAVAMSSKSPTKKETGDSSGEKKV